MRNWLERPETRGLSIDAPETTRRRRVILASTPLLRLIYNDWYSRIRQALPEPPGSVVELGSGPGFLRDLIPEVIRSDVLPSDGVDVLLDGTHLPFVDSGLRAVVMTNVLHHLPDVESFLRSAGRCVRAGGALVMIEPWVTPWSRFVYGRLHHERFDPRARSWHFDAGGPLSDANGALPWIVFERDRDRLEQEFPEWRIERIEPFMPFRYLITGGFSTRTFAPQWLFESCATVERALRPWMRHLGMFAMVVVRRTNAVVT
jgi:SAM-dependent methyltransferase